MTITDTHTHLYSESFDDDRKEMIERAIAANITRFFSPAIDSTYIKEESAFDIGGNLIGKEFIEELNTIDVWERAKKFKRDVLLIHGSNDQAVPMKDSMKYKEKCYQEQATLHIVTGADHTFNSYYWEKEVIKNICNFVK